VDCDRNAAVNFATLIDREGRALIKCAEFNVCSEAKSVIERITSRRNGKPLKVSIMHAHVVAHQNLALRLLAWMQDLLQLSVGFRAIFAAVLQELDPKLLLDAMLTSNTRLWKSCRSRVRHLLVTGMLMENMAKRQFARAFTRCYGEMMKEFMQDDHEHGVSITSLSVQLFTVPSLAHYLIANECVLAVLFRTFMSECEQRKGATGKVKAS
jgi:E3 ubiquitin-protein ligase UBR2